MFLTCAEQTAKKFDLIKMVLLLKSTSLGYTMVISRSETILYMSTPHRGNYGTLVNGAALLSTGP